MNNGTAVFPGLELHGAGVEPLHSEELISIGGGGVIVTGCLIAVGGAAVALVGVAVGVIVYAYINS